jgi:maltooligosyltrehalose trehalohydrolase
VSESYPFTARLGARPAGRETEFRVWAPSARESAVIIGDGSQLELREEGYGVWSARAEVPAEADYWIELNGMRYPDPCSRHQPAGIRGPSRVFDPSRHAWSDAGFTATALSESVIYELHIGTFSAAGTFDGAIPHLEELARLGVTTLELMPVAEGPGERGWGYDGVYISAAHHAYGGPVGLQRFVDAAHALDLAVILDVVYNHVGASGAEALAAFGPYFTGQHHTFWGDAINYDDELCDGVREWAIQSAESWIRDFHADGLRLDAIHAIHDESANPLVGSIADRVHALNARSLVIAEAGLNDPRVIRPGSLGGLRCDAQWADDFHHSLRVLLTGERDGYYADFGRVADLAKAFGRPFVHDGNWSAFRKRRFGALARDRPPAQFVVFSQNHDQIGNRPRGDRLPAPVRGLAAFCVLLAPFTPMLFMGEEYGEAAPFQFFTDHIDPAIAEATRSGRRREFAAFAAFAGEVPDPQDPATFAASKLTRRRDGELCALYAALIACRREVSGETEGVVFDEDGRWLRVSRGNHEMVCNFAPKPQSFTVGDVRLHLATAACTLSDGRLELPGLAGALLARRSVDSGIAQA